MEWNPASIRPTYWQSIIAITKGGVAYSGRYDYPGRIEVGVPTGNAFIRIDGDNDTYKMEKVQWEDVWMWVEMPAS